jgi:hypothetical protein
MRDVIEQLKKKLLEAANQNWSVPEFKTLCECAVALASAEAMIAAETLRDG